MTELNLVQVHFRAFPDVLLKWDGDSTLRAAYFNSLKVCKALSFNHNCCTG